MAVFRTERTEKRVGSIVAGSIRRAARFALGSSTADASALLARANAEMMIVDFMILVETQSRELSGCVVVSSELACCRVLVMSVGEIGPGSNERSVEQRKGRP
jgi:hypothetical protein